MARSIRIEFAGAFYHVMARGNRRDRIYQDDADRHGFLKALGEACAMTGWRVHAWVLLGNHYHLVIETPKPNLVAGMQWLQNSYTRRFNIRHQLWGRLFGDRYKAVLIEGEGEAVAKCRLAPVARLALEAQKAESKEDLSICNRLVCEASHGLDPNEPKPAAFPDRFRISRVHSLSDAATRTFAASHADSLLIPPRPARRVRPWSSATAE